MSKHSTSFSIGNGERGFALLLTIFTLTLLVVVVFDFSYATAHDSMISRHHYADLQYRVAQDNAIAIVSKALPAIEEQDTLEFSFQNYTVEVTLAHCTTRFNLNLLRDSNSRRGLAQSYNRIMFKEDLSHLGKTLYDAVVNRDLPLYSLRDLVDSGIDASLVTNGGALQELFCVHGSDAPSSSSGGRRTNRPRAARFVEAHIVLEDDNRSSEVEVLYAIENGVCRVHQRYLPSPPLIDDYE